MTEPRTAAEERSEVAVHLLSEWMEGTLTVVLESGGTFTMTASAHMAARLRRIVEDRQSEDVVRWPEGWLCVDPAKVAALRWEAGVDYGWAMSAAVRAAQRAHGHRSGMLATLVAHYRDGGEPSFSIEAVCVLNNLATTVDPEALLRYADLLEGVDGAVRAAAMWNAAKPAAPEHEETLAADDGLADPNARSTKGSGSE